MLAIQFALAADTGVTLHFPPEALELLLLIRIRTFFSAAICLVPQPRHCDHEEFAGGLKLNYDGSTSLAYLEKLKAPNLVHWK